MGLLDPQLFVQTITPSRENPMVQSWGARAAAARGLQQGLLSRYAPRAGVSVRPGSDVRSASKARNAGLLSLYRMAADTYRPLRTMEWKLRQAADRIQTTAPESAFLGGFVGSGGTAPLVQAILNGMDLVL